MTWWGILLIAAGGGFLTSGIEYLLKYNLIDKVIDLVRSTESKIANLQAKAVDAAKAISALKGK